jgi:hypothetical protein
VSRNIFIAQQAEHATKPVKRVHVGLEERLLGAVRERHRERRTGMTRPHVKQVDPRRRPSYRDLRLTPVDLRLHTRTVHLRHERLDPFAALGPAIVNVFPNSALSDISRVLITQPLPDPLRGMTLLARRIPVPIKPGVDQPPIRPKLRRRTTHSLALDGRQRRRERLTHRPPVNPIPRRQRPRRGTFPIPISPDLLERLHS